jgi:hypothetical protein
MTYLITKYTYNKAKQLGVTVKHSTNKTKKIDVYKKIKGKEHKVASVGAYGMNDYPTYTKKKGLQYAKTRRRLYKIRHNKDRKTRGTPGWYADKLLW